MGVGRAGWRRTSGQRAGGRVIEAPESTRNHSKMSSWEPMGGGRGGRGGQLQEEPQGAGGGECEGSPKKPQGAHDKPPVSMQLQSIQEASPTRPVCGRASPSRCDT